MPIRRQQQSNRIEIDLVELFFYLMDRFVSLMIVFAAGAVIVGVVSILFIEPKYTAVAKIYMVSASSESMVNLTDLNIGTSLSADYEQVIQIRPIYEEVIKNLELDYDVDELRDMISVGVVDNTRIMAISVTSTDPNEARDIANELSNITVNQIPRLMDTSEPNLIETAITPDEKSSPSYTLNTLVGGLVCLFLLGAVYTVQFVMDDTLKTESDVEEMFGVLPLAVIPEGDLGDHVEKPARKKKRTMIRNTRKKRKRRHV